MKAGRDRATFACDRCFSRRAAQSARAVVERRVSPRLAHALLGFLM